MTTIRTIAVDPDKISIGWRVRQDLGDINELSASIAKNGQLQPIVVSNGGGSMSLIAGMRRLTACKQLSRKVLAIVVEPEDELQALDMQIGENIKRKDFDSFEVGLGLKRRKELYEDVHPETKHGGAGRGRPKDTDAPRFTQATAKQIGLSETKVKDLIQVASLPKKRTKAITAAKTSRERNKAVADVLREVRNENKLAKLEARAEAAKKQPKLDGLSAVGDVRLHRMDNAEYFKKAIADEGMFDLILTDPPYETERQSLISHIKRGDLKKDFGAWDKLDVGWLVKAAPLLSSGAQCLIFAPLEALGDYREVCKSLDLTYKGAIIWHKTNPGTVHRPVYLSSVEAIVWIAKGTKYVFKPWDNAGARECHNVIEGPICGGNERLNHPTQKPEWLIQRLLERHAIQGTRILDPFAGVGTTLAVAKKLGMQAMGVELDITYASIAMNRIEAI